MRNQQINYYKQIIIKGNYFPAYEKRFGLWIDDKGEYEISKLLLSIACDISAKDVAIDIGANVGLYTRTMAKYYKNVIAFEPSSQSRACLSRNLEKGQNNVIVLPYAAGARNEKSMLYINPVNCGGNAIDKEYCDAELKEHIEIVRADSILKALTMDKHVSLIKIDVQGRELEVLKGLKETIQAHQPILLCEKTSNIRSRGDEINSFLKKFGYVKLARINKDILSIPKAKATEIVRQAWDRYQLLEATNCKDDPKQLIHKTPN